MSADKFTVKAFFARFPDDDACLQHIMEVRYGLRHTCAKCGVVDATFHKLASRPAYSCAHCGAHTYPCAGTIFQDSRTPLTSWFYAIYLFVVTRHGVSAKEIERQLGVTYKTAWRMGQQIRQLMSKADGFEAMVGHVEADETYVGGRIKGGKRGRATDSNKTVVAGLAERGGRKVAQVVPNASTASLKPFILENVAPGATISTDEHGGYNLLTKYGYGHGRVNHSKEEWSSIGADGKRHSTNDLESFWSLFKRSVTSTHISISPKYMDRYLGEFTFRSNHRQMKNAMFDLLIGAV
jgi:transposase